MTPQYKNRIRFWSKEEWTANRTLRLKSNLSISAALRETRTHLGISQQSIANKMGLSPSSICLKESGTSSFSDEQIRHYRKALLSLKDKS